MTKIEIVRAQMMQAMKDKNKERKDALSMLLSALKAKAIDKRADLTEDEENDVVMKELKQAKETLESAPQNRVDIINECMARISVYEEFAPKQMNEDDIRNIVKETINDLGISEPSAKDKGILMKNIMPKLKGKADGAVIGQIVGEFIK